MSLLFSPLTRIIVGLNYGNIYSCVLTATEHNNIL